MVAYGRSFDRDGMLIGLRAASSLRMLRLYLFQAALLLTVLVGAYLRWILLSNRKASCRPLRDRAEMACDTA